MPGKRPALRPVTVVLSCEHGGHRIPARYRELFRGCERLLESHRGYDAGALALARDFAAALHAELQYATVSRLLVELNRSPAHRQLFSPRVRRLPAQERQRIVRRYYRPYREALEARVAAAIKKGRRVVHVSCHSFTPRLRGRRRDAHIGLLFDPRRAPEARFCAAWRARLRAADPKLIVRHNYPYRGTSDGLTTYLRTRFSARSYIGMEIEVNQKFPKGDAARWRTLRRQLVATFPEC
jgi:predicted N-formylglutamate amidohydrolase